MYTIKFPPNKNYLVTLDVEGLLGCAQISLSLKKLSKFFSIEKENSVTLVDCFLGRCTVVEPISLSNYFLVLHYGSSLPPLSPPSL